MNPIRRLPVKVFHNGGIYGFPVADTLVVASDRISLIGLADELMPALPESEDVEHIDLDGKFVSPGFIDSHIHLTHTGLVESGWRVGLMGLSRSDALEKLAQAAADRGGEWVIGTGWDESGWQDCRYLVRAELDKIAPHSPLLAVRLDGHLLTANSVAMKQIPETAPGHLIERETGIFREQSAAVMVGSIQPDYASVVDAVDAAARLCHSLGITSVHTMSRLDTFEAMLTRRDQRKLRITICPEIHSLSKLLAVGLKTGFGDSWLRFGGVKIFADGSIGARNAAISEPYSQGGVGELNHEDETLSRWVEEADRAGWQTVIHAIGDRAIEQILRTHETVGTNKALQHRIEHCELPQGSQIPRVRAAGLHLCMQPNFISNWSGPDSMYADRLGIERDRMSNPLRAIHDAEIPLAFGSDGMPPSPLFGISGAIRGAYSSQRLTIDEAIACYTRAGAQLGFEGDEKGCLQPGTLADLVILDQDPRLDPERVAKRSVRMTFVGGDLVYSAGNSDDAALGIARR